MSEVKLTCIVCPNGCELVAEKCGDGSVKVAGNLCPKGVKFATDELVRPLRTFTGTAATAFPDFPVIAVKTDREVPKEEILRIAEYVNSLCLTKRCSPGDVIVKDVLGLGANLVVTADMN